MSKLDELSKWAKEEMDKRDNVKTTQHTTLFDFCNFIEKELKVTFTTQQWEIYRGTKKVSLQNERKDILDSFNQGYRDGELEGETNQSLIDISSYDNAKNYFENKFKND